MPLRKDSPNRSEAFGRLLSGAINSIATYEGRTTLSIEEELGQLLALSGKTLQRYKAGHLPPEDRTVAVLAEAAIQRGYLGREWLQRFLHAARYPFAERLLDRLCPVGPARVRPPRVYENLPAPTYNQFVMREQAFAEVTDGLQQRSAVVLIVGLGGNGKTSLAREVAARCLQDHQDAPRFDAVVWVSDKDRPGTTNLSVVLDEIARTLDYPGFVQFAHDEKLYEVGQLLKRQPVLVVVDNFETITDGALLAWLLRLPEPSKALVTSREYGREYRRGSWPVELRGMSEAEAREFVAQRLGVLRIAHLVDDLAQLDPLLVATGGNPKAIEMALGLVKHERRPLHQVVDDLYVARGELFDDLFTRAWTLLDEAARRVTLAMFFFPDSASSEALSATADVQGFAFDRVMERLTDLALLDVQQPNLQRAPRYALHPLVRAFTGARVGEQPDLERSMRERWVDYFLNVVGAELPMSWYETVQPNLDSTEQELANLHAVLQYCADTQRRDVLIEMAFRLNKLWSIRGYYEDRHRFVELALCAAEHERKVDQQVKLLCIQARTLCYLNKLQQALEYCARAQTLLLSLSGRPPALERQIIYSLIRVYLLLKNYEPIRELAERHIALSNSAYTKIGYSYDVAEYYSAVGRQDDAVRLQQEALESSVVLNDRLGILRGSLLMAKSEMEHGQLSRVEDHLRIAESTATEIDYRRFSAEVAAVYARLHMLRGDLPAAHAAFAKATDLFERLGLRRELDTMREELATLSGHLGIQDRE